MIAQNVTIYDSDAHEISGGRARPCQLRIGDHVRIGLSAIILGRRHHRRRRGGGGRRGGNPRRAAGHPRWQGTRREDPEVTWR